MATTSPARPLPAHGSPPYGDAEPAARALAALLGPHPHAVLIADASRDHVAVTGETLAEPALVRRLRDGDIVVVVTHTPGPTLLRALREHPPALLVLTGPHAPDLPNLPDTLVLGPDARLHVRPVPADSRPSAHSPVPADSRHLAHSPVPADSRPSAHSPVPADRRAPAHSPVPADSRPLAHSPVPADSSIIACATAPAELAALLAALSDRPGDLSSGPVRLAASPTPAWWPAWLADPALAGCTAVGFVPATALHPGWVRWAATQTPAAHVLVPEGLAAARVDLPRDPSLAAAVAAHALERWTGPVFPDPHVLALLAGARPEPTDATAAERATWAQACRALPLLAAAPGMTTPQLSPSVGAAAFLAQRALLRRARTVALAGEPDLAAPALDDAALARAEEVLKSAGQVLSEHESKVVLRGFGVEITRQAVASSASGAAQFAEQIGYPVVLKALSPDLRRKQDVGAVVLGLTTAAAVRRAYAMILQSVEHHAPTARLDGVLVAEQAPDGLEIECGAVRLADDQLALYGRPLGLPHNAEPILALSPLTARDARLLADAILARVPAPALRRASDPGVPELAALFLRLDALLRHFEPAPDLSSGPAQPGRLVSLELGPIRLIGPPRGYLTLDARIVQRAHLEGL